MTKSNLFNALLAALITVVGAVPFESSAQINADYSAVPPSSTQTDPPLVLLSMSRDHQYFFKAYNDYTDLDPEDLSDVDADGNPNIETTYKHSFDYFGYFDPELCYTYNGGADEFQPAAITADKYCSGAQWAGNFLNWASMTRMDIVRKIFYGGLRSTDSATKTVLERAHLPMDAHSFAKYYNGSDIAQLTPYNNVRSDTQNGGNGDGFDDIDEGITFCNTTLNNNTGASQNSTQPPLIRTALGNYQFWGANERWQCTYDNERGNQLNANIPPSAPVTFNIGGIDIGLDSGIDAHSSDPDSGDSYIVRVEVCRPNLTVAGERCKTYPDGNQKPTGLLQTYGDDGLIQFGLMTGSYSNNIEGGVLRKNMGPLSDEVNTNTNGTFNFTTSSDSIIRTLDRLRVWGYRYSNGTYLGGGTQFDDCTFQLSSIPNGDCKSWGNPISEIYKESIRYLAGLTPDNNFNADDSNLISGLTTASWNNPLTDSNQCADLNTIVINASVSSYDDDSIAINGMPGGLDGTSTTATNATTDTWTDDLGSIEGLNGRQFFVGQNGTNNNELCDAKNLGALSDVLGLCPEAPTVNGSFAMGGIAYYAHNNDIRSDLDGNQTVNTFAISLATNTPIIQVPRTDGGTPVEILPAYRLNPQSADPGGGALVDFKIIQPHTRIGNSNRFEGKYYVNWEDSEQGGDYDYDMWGKIEYVLDEDTDEIEITTTAVSQSTAGPQLFGFVTNGTTQDGFHAYSGILGSNYTDTTGVPGCNNCRALTSGFSGNQITQGQRGPQSHTFDIAPSTVGRLESPLYYAAKYGGFEETLAQGEAITLGDEPDEMVEWDAVNNTTGMAGADGLPDNFFYVINPENLFNSIENSLNKILSQNRAANSAVANLASSNGFGNIVVQGTYQERLLDTASPPNEVDWTGELFATFIDEFGYFREDNPTAGTVGKLDDYTIDLRYEYDRSGDVPRIERYNFTGMVDELPTFSTATTTAPVEELNTIWNAGDRLRNLNNNATRVQRNYSAAAPSSSTSNAASRYIFTYVDADLDGNVDAGEQINLDTASINNNNFQFFGVGSEAVADQIVDYVRGYEDPSSGLRNRTLNVDGQDTVFRLGDIVNSTPVVIAEPNQAYDTRFEDASYATFRNQYRSRRQVLYAGGNDGLLRAINVGFRDLNKIDVEYTETQGGKTAHPLGAEIWAYAPYNLLPHLQWLANPFYSHVFYVDGSPKAFDVKIFNNDATHPGGWGTILVVGMRQGGGDFPITSGSINTTTRSAYVVLDVTDPEVPPTVLAEITHPDLNLTTSEPDIFYDCDGLCSNNNDNDNFNGTWQIVFGSGPTEIRDFNTTETAKVFAYDLETGNLEMHAVTAPDGSALTRSFVGNVKTADWDNGINGFRNDDVVYFGTVGEKLDTSTTDPNDFTETGAVYRYRPKNNDSTSLLIDVDRPVVQEPIPLSRENLGNDVLGSWVYFGTGLLLNFDHEETNAQEKYYGIIEPINQSAVNNLNSANADASSEDSNLLTFGQVGTTDLINVTSVQVVNNDGGTLGSPTNPVRTGDFVNPVTAANGATNFDQLADYIITNTQGWVRDLPVGANTADPTARVIDQSTAFANQLFFTTFLPDTDNRADICVGGEGTSEIFAINQTTGTASPFATFGTNGTANSDGVVNTSLSLGKGAASAPNIFTSEALGSNNGVPFGQAPDGSLYRPELPTGAGGGAGGPGAGGLPLRNIELERSGWRELFQ